MNLDDISEDEGEEERIKRITEADQDLYSRGIVYRVRNENEIRAGEPKYYEDCELAKRQ